MDTPQQLHKWVEQYNWDDGLAPMWPIADWTRTEYATALRMYWLMGGPWLEGTTSCVEALELQRLIKARLLDGFYVKGALRYEPAQALTKVQIYILNKAGFPSELLTPRWPE